MKIIEYFEYDKKNDLLKFLKECDWKAGGFLAKLLENNTFDETLGANGKIFFLVDKTQIVSFVTLTQKDCIDDDSMLPWIGFVYTAPAFRGNRFGGQLIEHALIEAKKQGYKKVYLATDHIGLYEKYGFEYIENRIDLFNEDSRIYYINI